MKEGLVYLFIAIIAFVGLGFVLHTVLEAFKALLEKIKEMGKND